MDRVAAGGLEGQAARGAKGPASQPVGAQRDPRHSGGLPAGAPQHPLHRAAHCSASAALDQFGFIFTSFHWPREGRVVGFHFASQLTEGIWVGTTSSQVVLKVGSRGQPQQHLLESC